MKTIVQITLSLPAAAEGATLRVIDVFRSVALPFGLDEHTRFVIPASQGGIVFDAWSNTITSFEFQEKDEGGGLLVFKRGVLRLEPGDPIVDIGGIISATITNFGQVVDGRLPWSNLSKASVTPA